MTEPHLKLVVLKTNQLQLVRDFYTRLGFHFVEEQHGKGPRHFSAPLGDGTLEFYPLSDGTKADTTTRLGFSVSCMDSVIESLAALDAIASGPKQTAWGLQAIVHDPDGRTVELYETT